MVDMHDRRKRHRLFHVNMLKQFVSPVKCRMERCAGVEPQSRHDPQLGNNSAHDRKQKLLNYSDVFREGPRKTTLTVHDVDTCSAHPIRLPPCRLLHAYREAVHKELKEMLADGLIKPSESAWSAPIVPV